MSTAESDRFSAMLLTRAWPHRSMVDEFDAWQRSRHIPELVSVPGLRAASYYKAVEDGVPQVLVGSGNRIAIYWSRGLDDLLIGLTHPGLAAAVEDGSRFFPHFNELDGDTYTGNIYLLDPAPEAAPHSIAGAVLIQRYEVPPSDANEFETWLRVTHLPQLAATSCVESILVGHAVRQDLPIPYYNSKGSHLVFAALTDPRPNDAVDRELADVLADAQRWDRRLHYVRREIARLEFQNHAERQHG